MTEQKKTQIGITQNTKLQWVVIAGVAMFVMGLVATGFYTAFTWWSALMCLVGLGMASMLFLPKFSKNIRTFGDIALYSVVVIIALIVAFSIFLRHPVSFDATERKLYSLSPITRDFLERLDRDISITAFVAENERDETARLLGEYSRYSQRISTKVMNPFQDFAASQQYGTVTHGDIFIETQTTGSQESGRLVTVNKTSEESLTNGIIQVLRGKDIKVYFISGHGEPPIASAQNMAAIAGGRSNMNDVDWLKKQLERNRVKVDSLNISQRGRIPSDANAIVCIAPREDFSGSECMAVRNYLDNGGRLLACLSPELPQLTPTLDNLRSLLSDYGLEFPDAVAFSVDVESRTGGAPGSGRIEVAPIGKHRVNQVDPNAPLLLTTTRVLKEAGNHSTSIMVEPLLQTATKVIPVRPAELAQSIMARKQLDFTYDPLSLQPLTVAYAVTVYHETRNEDENTKLVVVGSGDFLNTENITQSGYLLFMNAINWLTSDADLVTVPTNEIENTPLVLSDGTKRFLFILMVILIPLLVGLFGLGYSILRREWL